MTALSDFIATINSWTGINHPDPLVTSWVRMAEEEFNNKLRYKDMIEREVATLSDNCVNLPEYWLDIEIVRAVGGGSYDYLPVTDFWDRFNGGTDKRKAFTIVGNTLFVSPAVDAVEGTQIELHLYTKIEPLETESNWLLDNHPSVYTFNTLKYAAPYLDEDTRVATWGTIGQDNLNAMNDRWKSMKYGSGKPLKMKARSFG